MGSSTRFTVVPLKIEGEQITSLILKMSLDEYGDEISSILNGWAFDWNSIETYKCLSCQIIKKNNLKLFVVNEAQWANGGENQYCIFSTNKNNLLEFCNDSGLNVAITENEIVSQTG